MGWGFSIRPRERRYHEVTLKDSGHRLGTGAGQPAQSLFDPKITYDQYSGRFIVVTSGGSSCPNSWLMVAVSATSDPTGAWNKWAIDADLENTSQWADFPALGLDSNNVYLTANMFNNSRVYQYSKVWVIPKAQLLAGANPIAWTEFAKPPGSGFTIQPAHGYGTSSAEYLVHEGYLHLGTAAPTIRPGLQHLLPLGYPNLDRPRVHRGEFLSDQCLPEGSATGELRPH